jgi:hypothetical protein
MDIGHGARLARLVSTFVPNHHWLLSIALRTAKRSDLSLIRRQTGRLRKSSV